MNINYEIPHTDLQENTQTAVKLHLEWLFSPQETKGWKMNLLEGQKGFSIWAVARTLRDVYNSFAMLCPETLALSSSVASLPNFLSERLSASAPSHLGIPHLTD